MARVAAGQDGGPPEAETRAFSSVLQVKTSDSSCACQYFQVANVLFICRPHMHFIFRVLVSAGHGYSQLGKHLTWSMVLCSKHVHANIASQIHLSSK